MVLMVVASCISGAASALTQYFGLNYYLGTFVIGLVVLFLTIFGVDLIRRASTYMGVVILVLAVSIYTVGLLNGHNLLDVMRVDFSVHGWSQLPKAVWNRCYLFSFPMGYSTSYLSLWNKCFKNKTRL